MELILDEWKKRTMTRNYTPTTMSGRRSLINGLKNLKLNWTRTTAKGPFPDSLTHVATELRQRKAVSDSSP